MGLEVGDKLHALFGDGKFYPAEVIAVSESKNKKKAPIKVRFVGYGPETDAWLPFDNLKSKKLPKEEPKPKAAPKKGAAKAKGAPTEKAGSVAGLNVGTKLQAQWEGIWYAAEVVATSTSKNRKQAPIKVHFLGMDPSDDSWMALDALRSKALKVDAAPKASAKATAKGKAKAKEAPAKPAKVDLSGVKPGMKLQAALEGIFYAAEVVTVSNSAKRAKAPIKVHFTGYGPEDDKWMPLDELKSKAIPKASAKGKAKAEPKGKAKAAAKEAPATSPAADLSKLKPGSKLQADYEGTFCAAEVVTVSTAKARKKAPIKVHYVGFSDEFDTWLPVDKVKSKAIGKAKAAPAPKAAAAPAPAQGPLDSIKKGMRLQAESGGKLYVATVVEVNTSKKWSKAPVKVHYAGQPDEYDEWLPLDKLKSKAIKAPGPAMAALPAPPTSKSTPASGLEALKPGTKLQVIGADGVLYAAEVLATSTAKKREKAPIRVHFVGHDASYDDWVPEDKVKSKLLKAAAKAPAAKGKAKAAPKASVPAQYAALEVGARLQGEIEGVWYAGEVKEISSAKKRAKAPVKVHFLGYPDEDDLWLGAERLRSKAIAAPKAAPKAKSTSKGKGKGNRKGK